MPYFQALNCCGVKEIAVIQEFLSYPGKTNTEKLHRLMETLFAPGYIINGKFKLVDGKNKFVQDKEPTLVLQGGHFFFTDAHEQKRRYGKIFAKFILKEKLGTVIGTKQAPNPNYLMKGKGKRNQMHMITAYVWTPDYDALLDYCARNLTPRNTHY